ncbi:hypothetical protein [Flavobacterium alkalisoli]|uniref:hypothetical protein n=1 Tax=Flavobacterium alkalisoli TaxID=2602769 RepID=UPI003A94EDA0
MSFDYGKFEKDLETGCNEAYKEFLKEFNSDSTYISAGGGKLEAFIEGLQKEFDKTKTFYLKKHKLENDPEARRRALAVAKQSAKKCIEEFSRIQ